MSGVESRERFRVYVRSAGGYKVVDRRKPFGAVDAFLTRSAAEYAARLLNAGVASVDCHAVLGCKVVER